MRRSQFLLKIVNFCQNQVPIIPYLLQRCLDQELTKEKIREIILNYNPGFLRKLSSVMGLSYAKSSGIQKLDEFLKQLPPGKLNTKILTEYIHKHMAGNNTATDEVYLNIHKILDLENKSTLLLSFFYIVCLFWMKDETSIFFIYLLNKGYHFIFNNIYYPQLSQSAYIKPFLIGLHIALNLVVQPIGLFTFSYLGAWAAQYTINQFYQRFVSLRWVNIQKEKYSFAFAILEKSLKEGGLLLGNFIGFKIFNELSGYYFQLRSDLVEFTQRPSSTDIPTTTEDFSNTTPVRLSAEEVTYLQNDRTCAANPQLCEQTALKVFRTSPNRGFNTLPVKQLYKTLSTIWHPDHCTKFYPKDTCDTQMEYLGNAWSVYQRFSSG